MAKESQEKPAITTRASEAMAIQKVLDKSKKRAQYHRRYEEVYDKIVEKYKNVSTSILLFIDKRSHKKTVICLNLWLSWTLYNYCIVIFAISGVFAGVFTPYVLLKTSSP